MKMMMVGANRLYSINHQLAFVAGAVLTFYCIVFGLSLEYPSIVVARSMILVLFSAIVLRLDRHYVLTARRFDTTSLSSTAVLGFGMLCYLLNAICVGAVFYFLFRGFVSAANEGFDISTLSRRPVALKLLMAFAAALSEEVVYRKLVFRHLVARTSMSVPIRYGLAFGLSSLMFGFGHFHAGFEKCVIVTFSGLLFGGVYLWKRDLRVVVLGHFLGDAVALLL